MYLKNVDAQSMVLYVWGHMTNQIDVIVNQNSQKVQLPCVEFKA